MIITRRDFANKEYEFRTKRGILIVAKSPAKGAKRIHLYVLEGVTQRSLGWFRDEDSANLFLEILD